MAFRIPPGSYNFDNNNLTQVEIDLQGLAEEFSLAGSDLISFPPEDRSATDFREDVHMVIDLTHGEGTRGQANASEEPRMTSNRTAPATMPITIDKVKKLLANCYPTIDPKAREYFDNLIKYKQGLVKAETKYLLELEEKQIISAQYSDDRCRFSKALHEEGISTKKTDNLLIKTEFIRTLTQNLDPNFSDKETSDYFNNILLPFCENHRIIKVDIVKFGAAEAIIKLQTLFNNLKESHKISVKHIDTINCFISRILNELKSIPLEPAQNDSSFPSEDNQLPFDLPQFQGSISQGHRYPFNILSFEQEINAPEGNLMSIADAEEILLSDLNPTPLSIDDRSARSVTSATFDVIDLTNDEGRKKRKTNSNEKPKDRT